jgi:hypothetical protein
MGAKKKGRPGGSATEVAAPKVKRVRNPKMAERQPGNVEGWTVEYDELPKEAKVHWEAVREGTKRR